jgi:hypothetical protein
MLADVSQSESAQSVVVRPEEPMRPAKRPWTSLNTLQLGRFAEYHVTMALVRAGLDVYTPAIDDRGIDLVARLGPGKYLEIQVKATRGFNYVFMRKSVFAIDPFRYLAYVLFAGELEPAVYLVPSTVWQAPNSLFISRDYQGKKSPPEYGLSVTMANRQDLERFRLDAVLTRIFTDQAETEQIQALQGMSSAPPRVAQ